MSTYNAIQSKLSGNVIDIQGASTKSGALLDAFAPKTSGNDNQLWEFVADPSGSGYYFIKSKLSGNVIDIQEASTKSGALLDAYPQKTTGSDNQLWTFVPDSTAAGYCFIRNKLSGNVIDIQGASTKSGALLDAFQQKTNGAADNQLWKVVDGAFPAPVYTSISWGPEGTGPAPNSSTVGNDGNECAYQASLSISQDGTCTFSGYYQNRGDVWWGTAPPQGFVVAFIVYDTSGKAYALTYSGVIPSAPQNGSLITWNVTQKYPAIAENWYAIAAKNSGGAWWYNTYDESIWGVVGGWFSSLGSDIETAAVDIWKAWESYDGGGETDGGGDDGDDAAQVRQAPLPKQTPLPPLPAKAPTGAAATAHQVAARIAGKGK
jgi:hypothetical protein